MMKKRNLKAAKIRIVIAALRPIIQLPTQTSSSDNVLWSHIRETGKQIFTMFIKF